VAIGSRGLGEDLVRLKQPFHRRLLGKAGNLLVRLLAVPGIRDTQCGFKLFRGDVARDLFAEARIDGFAYDMEILFLARRRGLSIAEVPVLWFNSLESKVSVVRDSLRTLWDLLRLRWIHRRSPWAHRRSARPDAASTARLVPSSRFAPAARASSLGYCGRLRAPRPGPAVVILSEAKDLLS
jgi:dolichyl-phosphate beta-glucosyltransferase